MEIDYVDKLPDLKSNWLNYEILIASHKLQLARESIKNIFSISKFKGKDKEFNSLFKNIFGFSSPNISNVNYTDKYTVLWVRNNCCFVLSYTKSKEIQYKNLLSIFENTASITDQTGGWVVLNLEGDDCRFLLEKLITIDLDNFDNHHVIRTSIASINCFIVCETKFQRYNLICPTSYFATIKSRLIKLITLLQ